MLVDGDLRTGVETIVRNSTHMESVSVLHAADVDVLFSSDAKQVGPLGRDEE